MKVHHAELSIIGIVQQLRAAAPYSSDLSETSHDTYRDQIMSRLSSLQQCIIKSGIKNRFIQSLKNINMHLKKFKPYQKLFSRLYLLFRRLVRQPEGVFVLNDFINYNKEDFIIYAYSILIGYEPEREKVKEYLNLMKNGSITKLDILWMLRHTPEGKQLRIKIKSLCLRYTASKVFGMQCQGPTIK